MQRLAPFAVVLSALAVASGAASQRTGLACEDTGDYWADSLGDALVDRAPFVCACREGTGPASLSIDVTLMPQGRIGRITPSHVMGASRDEASCVAHRVHEVVHAWLASTSAELRARHASSADHRVAYSLGYPEIACPPPGGHDAQSGLSRAFLESHPDGLRRGTVLPPPACRRPIAATLEIPIQWGAP